jgi:uncharacterized repeat protein (TIGR02543 family)
MRRLNVKASIFFFLILSLDASPAFADSDIVIVPCTNGSFEIENNAVVRSSDCMGEAIIPDSVTTISDYAFFDSGLTSIVIPAGVTSIGNEAFYSTTALESVSFSEGSSLTSLGYGAFAFATSLTTINIPAGVTSIGDFAFQYATSLTTINIPADVTSIGDYVFSNSISLATVVFAENSELTSIGDRTFAFATALTSINIPAGVTTIGYGAFSNATALESVVFAENSELTIIGDGAFSATALTSINFPAGINTIGHYAFADSTSLETVVFAEGSELTSIGIGAFSATALTSINIPAGVTSIGDYAFYYATALTSINIPASLTSIGDSAFSNTTSLETVVFAENSELTSIGDRTFAFATALTSINIPAGVTSIGNYSFVGATALTSVNIPASVAFIGYGAFYNATALESLVFAENSELTSIGDNAFAFATALTSITIPASVDYIDYEAFNNASKLANFYFLGNAPAVDSSSFTGVAAGAKAYITSRATGFPNVGSIWERLLVDIEVHAVTYNSNSGSSVTPGSFTTGGEISSAPTQPTRSGYTFAGWSATNGGSLITFPYEPKVTQAITLYAKWTANTYTLTYRYNSATGGNKAATARFTTGGVAITLPTPTRTNYTFGGWYSDAGFVTKLGNAGASYSPTGATRTLGAYAKWARIPVKAAASTKPTISGKATSTTNGTNKLTAKIGTWTGYPAPVISYQWYLCTKQVPAATQTTPTTCKAISKATTTSLAVTKGYKGKFLTVLVTGKGAGTSATKWLSKSTTKVN